LLQRPLTAALARYTVSHEELLLSMTLLLAIAHGQERFARAACCSPQAGAGTTSRLDPDACGGEYDGPSSSSYPNRLPADLPTKKMAEPHPAGSRSSRRISISSNVETTARITSGGDRRRPQGIRHRRRA